MPLNELEKELRPKYGEGFSRRNLARMIIFYKDYSDGATVSPNLSWSHYSELLALENYEESIFYERECSRACWNVRELRRQIKSSLYERVLLGELDITSKNELITKDIQEYGNPSIMLNLNGSNSTPLD